MHLSEEKLTGWLVFWRLQHGSRNDGIICVPHKIWKAWEKRGWIELDVAKPDEYGYLPASLTDKGLMVTDLNGPEWGVETCSEAA